MPMQRDVPGGGAKCLRVFHELFGHVSSFQPQNIKARVVKFGKAVKFAVVRTNFRLESSVDGADRNLTVERAGRGGGRGGRGGADER